MDVPDEFRRRGNRLTDTPTTDTGGSQIRTSHGLENSQANRSALIQRVPFVTVTVAALLAFCAGAVFLASVVNIRHFRDVSFPDSAILMTVQYFAETGRIYTDLTRPPYMVAPYGPLTYAVLSLAYRAAGVIGQRPEVAVRVVLVAAFACSLFLVFLISRRLSRSTTVGWLSFLFAAAVLPIARWTTQIRGDFLALSCSLLGVSLFLRATTLPQTLAAATVAGLAVLFKQTFVTAPAAMVVCLLWERRFKDAAYVIVLLVVLVAGAYGLLQWREPLMVEHFRVLSRPFFDYGGALSLMWKAIGQPVVPFAAAGVLLAMAHGGHERRLILTYCLFSWLLATVTITHVGANINYFWEPLFISAILAGPAVYELQRRVAGTGILTAMVVLVLIHASIPGLREQYAHARESVDQFVSHPARQARWHNFTSIIQGRRLLSTIPSVTIHSSSPEAVDPFTNSFMRDDWDSSPLVTDIKAKQYELVVVLKGDSDQPNFYRGLRLWNEGIWSALRANYKPACLWDRMEIWLPDGGGEQLRERLLSAGCIAVPPSGYDQGSAN